MMLQICFICVNYDHKAFLIFKKIINISWYKTHNNKFIVQKNVKSLKQGDICVWLHINIEDQSSSSNQQGLCSAK